MKQPKGFFTYFHHASVLEMLSDEDAGWLYKALMRYGESGEIPELKQGDPVSLMFVMFKKEIDYNVERYNEICEKRSEAGKKSALLRQQAKQEEKNDSVNKC